MARVVVVSGGGTGIGRSIAERFAQAGDQPVLVGRRADVLDRAADEIEASTKGVRPFTVAADLSEPDQADSACGEILARHKDVHVLVNAAGGNVEIGAPAESTAGLAGAAWRWSGNFRTNVLAAVLPTEALKDALADDGRVLFLSSIAAFRGSGTGSYAAAKAALHPYAFDLAAQLGPRGITVNVIAPGYIENTEFFRSRMSEQRRQTLIGQTSTHRPGTPADVAETAHWLASPEAGHVTAQIVQVNGGAFPGR